MIQNIGIDSLRRWLYRVNNYGDRGKKGKGRGKGNSQRAGESELKGLEGWIIGKKLGLLSMEGGELMEKIIYGEGFSGEVLGAKKNNDK